jgi:hypothetical protein
MEIRSELHFNEKQLNVDFCDALKQNAQQAGTKRALKE